MRRAVLASAALALAVPARAYRPFVSTDAAAAAYRSLELELGAVGASRAGGRTTWSSPQATLNAGVRPGWEAVGEFTVVHPDGGPSQVRDADLALKGVLRRGALQDAPGASVAEETTLLLPASGEGDPRAGAEQALIVSHRLGPTTWHWNLGGGWERSAGLPFGSWGVVAESPAWRGARAVGELSGEAVRGSTPDASGLLGLVWEPGRPGLAFDAGWRRGLSAAAADWSVTAGLTLALSF